MLLVIGTFILPIIFSKGAISLDTHSVLGVILLFLFYLVSYFVVIFFNVGLISCVNAKLQGNNMTVGEGFSEAGRHIGSILAWAVIAATVGLVLRMIEDRAGVAGQVAAGIAGGVWSLVTMFVVPVLIFLKRKEYMILSRDRFRYLKRHGVKVLSAVSP